MWSFDDLFLFVKVAEVGNFSHASKLIGVGQSTISTRIKKLEQSLNVTLFRRTTKSMELTDVGKKLLSAVQDKELDLIQCVNSAVARNEMPSGILRVLLPFGFASNYVIPRLIEFTEAYPEIKLHIFFESKEPEISKHGIDYAITSFVPEQQNLKIKFLFESNFILFCTPEYKNKYGAPKTLEELSEHKVFTMVRNFEVNTQIDTKNLKTGKSSVLKFSDNLAFNNSMAAEQIVYSNKIIGGGFKFMVASKLKNKELTHILPDYSFASVRYYQVRHPNEAAAKVNVFAKFIEECVNNYLADV